MADSRAVDDLGPDDTMQLDGGDRPAPQPDVAAGITIDVSRAQLERLESIGMARGISVTEAAERLIEEGLERRARPLPAAEQRRAG